jgi:hypothetical protein
MLEPQRSVCVFERASSVPIIPSPDADRTLHPIISMMGYPPQHHWCITIVNHLIAVVFYHQNCTTKIASGSTFEVWARQSSTTPSKTRFRMNFDLQNNVAALEHKKQNTGQQTPQNSCMPGPYLTNPFKDVKTFTGSPSHHLSDVL